VDEGVGDDDRTLVEVLTAEPVAEDRFVASMPNWFNGHAFGGVVLGQAVSAALQSVGGGADLHSFHGYFLRPVAVGREAEVQVDHVRDGRTFRTRQVDMRQGGRTTLRALCSFHAPEVGEEYQLSMPGDVPPPEELDPPLDRPGPPQASVDVRDAQPTERDADGTYRSTRRVWFRYTAPIAEDPTAHVAVAAFLSDMTGTGFRPNNLSEMGTHTDASLDHALWFHQPIRVDEWLFYDIQAVVNHGARSVVRGSMYSRDGVLRFSMMQELLIRPLSNEEP
jgi:acyl-CoA thioesterase-2